MASDRHRKGAATKLGITLPEYDARVAAGEWRCSGCRAWHPGSMRGSTPGYCNESTRRRRHDRAVMRQRQSQDWKDRLARVLVK